MPAGGGRPARADHGAVQFSGKMPTVGDAGDVTFRTVSYVIGDREMMMVDSSTHFKSPLGRPP
jgi:hypothetical protein